MLSSLCAFGSSFLHRSVRLVQSSTPSRIPSFSQTRLLTPSRIICLHSSLRDAIPRKSVYPNWTEEDDSNEKSQVVGDPEPAAIYLMEALESFFLATSLLLQLIPVLHKTVPQLQRKVAPSRAVTIKSTTDSKKDTKEIVSITPNVTWPLKGKIKFSPETLELLPVISYGALLIAVVFGSFVRRFQRHQTNMISIKQREPVQILTKLEREELDEQLSRVFSEISQLAGQMDRLRVKVRLVSSEYGPIIEATAQDSSRLRSAVRSIGDQIKDMEDHLSEVDKVMLKLEGVATKQFEIVSFALRRIDSDCKELKNNLNPVLEMRKETV
eukprot:g2737.t1